MSHTEIPSDVLPITDVLLGAVRGGGSLVLRVDRNFFSPERPLNPVQIVTLSESLLPESFPSAISSLQSQ